MVRPSSKLSKNYPTAKKSLHCLVKKFLAQLNAANSCGFEKTLDHVKTRAL